MAIKVTLGATENTQQEKPFPKLMVVAEKNLPDTGIIVLFEKESNGTVVYTPNDYRVLGYSSDAFLMQCFTDYNEPITIQNL